MIVNGRCRGNGAQLAEYLLNSRDNDYAQILGMGGVTSNDPRRALIEMSLTSEIYGRTNAGLYHTQLSPRRHEAAEMTWEQKFRSAQILAEELGMEGHKWALFEHQKNGRTHLHMVFERYNHDTGLMWNDRGNYDKHKIAARQMEIEFGWQLTHEKKNRLDKDIKDHLTDLWLESKDGADFVRLAHRSGFEVTQGMDRRPYQLVDQYGTVHDLAKQIQGIRQGDISEYLNSIRSELRPTAEASQDRRQQYERSQPAPEQPKQSDNLRDLSDSQDAIIDVEFEEVIEEVMPEVIPEKEPEPLYSYGFKVEQPPTLPRDMEKIIESEKIREKSEREQAERQRKAQEMKEQAKEQTRRTHPITGQEMTQDAWDKYQQFLKRQNEREQESRDRSRGLEY